jgi:hypothetical protein
MHIFKSRMIKGGCNDEMVGGELERVMVMGRGWNLALKHAYFKGNMFWQILFVPWMTHQKLVSHLQLVIEIMPNTSRSGHNGSIHKDVKHSTY